MFIKINTKQEKHSWLLMVLVVLIGSNGVDAIDYCGSKVCKTYDAHTLCRYKRGHSKNCTNYRISTLSADEKNRILVRLNRRRSEVARGLLRGMPCASNMLRLQWLEDLARVAQRWADQCRPFIALGFEEHDVCRDLYSITVGQCVATLVGETSGLLVESLVDIWYMQNKYFRGNVTRYVKPLINTTYYYGDFAQMLFAASHVVGCGRSRFWAEWKGQLQKVERLVCNFGPRGPSPNEALYLPGITASACKDGSVQVNGSVPELQGLCDFTRSDNSAYQRMLHQIEHDLANADIGRKFRSMMQKRYVDNGNFTKKKRRKKSGDETFKAWEKPSGVKFQPKGDSMFDSIMKYVPYLKRQEHSYRANPGLNNASAFMFVVIYTHSYLFVLFLYFLVS